MKNRIIIFAMLLLSAFVFFSCEDESKVIIKDEIGSNELNALSASDYILTLEEAADQFEEFNWTKTDFGFPASITYKIQIDLGSGDFSAPVEIASVNNALTTSLTVGEMNKKLLEMELNPDEPVEMQIRVVSIINDSIDPIYSSVKTFTVTPYATSFPPIYMVGEALNGWNWDSGTPVEVLSNAPKIYETVAKFTNGKAFRFFAQQDWGPTSYNYPFFTTVDPLFENALDGDSNLKFIGTTGYYKVTVDLKNKTVAMLSVPEPVLYMVGAAINGWNWDPGTPVKMTFVKVGVFQATTNFSVEAFRFFAQADWGPTSYNYPYFTTVDAKFENANDGDKNLKFIGTPGSFTIRVDLNTKVVTMN